MHCCDPLHSKKAPTDGRRFDPLPALSAPALNSKAAQRGGGRRGGGALGGKEEEEEALRSLRQSSPVD